jgi:hypothetical protein
LFANIKKAYFLGLSTFLAALSILLAEESILVAEESILVAEESTCVAAESDFASVLELLLQAAKAPMANTTKNFFMFRLFVVN